MSQNIPSTLTLDVISDSVCPWCYIGKRRLERAIAMRPNLTFDVRWRPFQLDASIPPGGYDRKAYLAAKFGDGPRPKAMADALRNAGSEEGIAFAFDRIERSPNTLDSHRIVRWAASLGKQNEAVESLFRRYFIEGQDIGARPTLVEAAAEIVLDTDLVNELLDSDADTDRIAREDQLARQLGVEGVPAYVIADRYILVGAQDPEILVQVFDRAASELATAKA